MDDFVLNIAPPSAGSSGVATVKAQKQKGGRWTERVKANKQIKRPVIAKPKQVKPAPAPKPAATPRPQPSARPQQSAPSSSRPSTSSYSKPKSSTPAPPPKKFKFDDDAGEEYDEDTYEDRAAPAQASGQASSSKSSKQVVSSLFSRGDKLKAEGEGDGPDDTTRTTNFEPASNAPSASSSATTFDGLGLDPLLTHHLQTKMSISHPTQIQRASLPFTLNPPSDRDVFIQSQTGSGKTLTYLLPIIQSLLPLSSLSWIDRSVGTLAIILVPTRELAKQISDVLDSLLSLNLSLPTTSDSDPQPQRRTRWIVPGVLTGGSTRTHEKARLRKGCPIIVSTPGRLLDHLQNTTSFDVSKLRWLVLDEADRLMDLGFEETITGILKGLEGRRKLALEARGVGAGGLDGGWDWSVERRTVLCSATVREDVQKLAGVALRKPVVFRATDVKPGAAESALAKPVPSKVPSTDIDLVEPAQADEEKFTPPSQLSQKHIVVPPKLRLVTLVALLRSLLAKTSSHGGAPEGRKVIVFLSTTDAVDFHWKMLGGVGMGGGKEESGDEEGEGDEDSDADGAGPQDLDSDEEETRAMIKQAKASAGEIEDEADAEPAAPASKKSKKKKPPTAAQKAAKAIKDEPITYTSTLLPNTTIHRLHGSLPLQTRLASLKSFATPTSTTAAEGKPSVPQSSILFCTSVASRGLDLPLVRAVVQYDLPTEGGGTEYVHRVGRTARVGRGGEAWAFVGPGPEQGWVGWIESKMGEGTKVGEVGVEGVLRKGFGGKGDEWENRATEVQGAFERWVLSKTKNTTLAQKAFQSSIRSYSTHPLEEKRFFHLKNLHLGHLAKSFALRAAPSQLPTASSATAVAVRPAGSKWERDADEGKGDAEKRMQEAVRKQGRETKRGGVLGVFGGSDYQIAGTGELEKMVGAYGAGGKGGSKRKRN